MWALAGVLNFLCLLTILASQIAEWQKRKSQIFARRKMRNLSNHCRQILCMVTIWGKWAESQNLRLRARNNLVSRRVSEWFQSALAIETASRPKQLAKSKKVPRDAGHHCRKSAANKKSGWSSILRKTMQLPSQEFMSAWICRWQRSYLPGPTAAP